MIFAMWRPHRGHSMASARVLAGRLAGRGGCICRATGGAIVVSLSRSRPRALQAAGTVGQHLSSLRRGVARTVPPAISRCAVVVGLPQGGTRCGQPRINCAARSVASRTNSNLPTSGDPNVMWADALQRSDRSRAIVIGGRKEIRRAMLPVGAHPEKFEDATRNAGGRQMRLTRQYTLFVLVPVLYLMLGIPVDLRGSGAFDRA